MDRAVVVAVQFFVVLMNQDHLSSNISACRAALCVSSSSLMNLFHSSFFTPHADSSCLCLLSLCFSAFIRLHLFMLDLLLQSPSSAFLLILRADLIPFILTVWTPPDSMFLFPLIFVSHRLLFLLSLPPRPSGPNRSKLQDMLANLRDAEDHPSMQPSVAPPSRPPVPRLNEHELGRPEDGNLLSFSVHCPIINSCFLHQLYNMCLISTIDAINTRTQLEAAKLANANRLGWCKAIFCITLLTLV